jgi:hypothetical protein
MKHTAPTWIRKGKVLTPADPTDLFAKKEVHPSISAAKRRSSILQKANGGLGCGYVRVAREK